MKIEIFFFLKGKQCTVCMCNEDAHDFPLTSDNCLIPFMLQKSSKVEETETENNSSAKLNYCYDHEKSSELYSDFTSGNGSATMAFRFQKLVSKF